MMRRRRTDLSPILDTAPSFCFPSVDRWTGVTPSQAAKSRPLWKVSAGSNDRRCLILTLIVPWQTRCSPNSWCFFVFVGPLCRFSAATYMETTCRCGRRARPRWREAVFDGHQHGTTLDQVGNQDHGSSPPVFTTAEDSPPGGVTAPPTFPLPTDRKSHQLQSPVKPSRCAGCARQPWRRPVRHAARRAVLTAPWRCTR